MVSSTVRRNYLSNIHMINFSAAVSVKLGIRALYLAKI